MDMVIGIIIFLIFTTSILYALCVAAGKDDLERERMAREWEEETKCNN